MTRRTPRLPHPSRARRTTGAAAALAAALVLAACGGDATGNEDAVNDDGSVDLAKVTLIVGDQKASSAEALLEAAGLGDTEYTIDFQEFSSGPPMLEALGAEAIHVGMVGNTPPLFAAAAGDRFKVAAAASYTGLGDAILVPQGSPAKTVADLLGKTVAVAQGSSANYHLVAQLENAGLSYDDVTVKNLQPGDALTAFDGGHVDAWTVWEPYTSQAEQTAGARVLADGEDLVNGLNFQVVSESALEDPATKAALADYLNRITRAQIWSSQHQDEWAKVWAAQTGLDPAITRAAAERRPVTPVPVDQEVIDSEQEMADTFFANGLLPEKIDIADYFTDEFTEQTTGESVEQQ